MKSIPVEAKVVYADGAEAESRGVIVEGGTRNVTHYVVEDEHLARPPYERLVPVDQVEESTHDLIRLRCTQEEVGRMQPFTTTRYVLKGTHDYSLYEGGEGPGTSASTVGAPGKAQEEELIPEGELAIRRGTRVEATDGYVGQVDELLAEEGTRVVSQVILAEGHLFGQREVALPLLAIDRAEGDTIYLRLDKAGIERLPEFIGGHRQSKTHEFPSNTQLVAQVYDDPERASKALEFVEDLHRQKVLKILNAAVLAKQEDGTVSVTDTRDMGAKKGGLIGAVAGGLIGILGGPVGVIVGALAGAGVGGLGAKLHDGGFSDKFLAELEEQLQPGKSALVILVEEHWVHSLSEVMAEEGGVFLQETLSEELVRGLLAESEAKE
jgi:uncharacterized membrane protein